MSDICHPYHVICKMCSKTFSDPRMLPCLHSFCCQCLHFELEKAEQSIQCPTCQTNVPIPVGGASTFPQNLHLTFEAEFSGYMSNFVSDGGMSCTFCVNGCTDPAVAFCCSCTKFLCKGGQESHKRAPQLSHHSIIGLDKVSAEQPTVLKRTEMYCSHPNHETKELDLYCNTCCNLICNNCIIDSHKDHDITPLCIIAEADRDDMNKTLQCAHEIASKLADAIVANERMTHQVVTSKQEAELAIEHAFRQLMETLEERKKAMLLELNTVSLSKVTSLALQKEQFENIQTDIGHHPKMISHILQIYTDPEVVALRGLVPTELKAILEKVKNISLIPSQQSYLKFSVQAEPIAEELSEVGEIVELSPSPHSSKLEIGSAVSVNTTWPISVETLSSNGERYPCGGLQVVAELRPKSCDGPVASGEVEDHGDGTYTITLTPQTAGPYKLLVTMDGQHVPNSPYNVKVKGDYTTLCDSQEDISINEPYGIAIHESGDIYVVSGDDCIYVFDQVGQEKLVICGSGSLKGRFNRAIGIAIKRDVIYCADCGNHRIQKLSIGGKCICMFGKIGSGQGQFNEPWDVIVDSEERMIISDSGNNRIQVFNRDEGWLHTINGSGSGDQAFTDPRGLALDPEGNLHVAAYGSDAVKVFTPDGTFIRMYGDLMGPIGIAIDDKGYSFVSESRGNSLSIFDPKGIKIHTVGNLNSPFSVALDAKNGSVFISNFGSGQVLKYTY